VNRQPANSSNDSADGPAIGIDLGTTYSAVACVDDTGKPYCLPNLEGDMLTPTAVLVDDHAIVIGREAAMAAAMEPDDFAECFKRDVGSPVYRRGIRGVHVPPQILSAFVLEQLKSDAERRLGSIQRAVITVPAFFDEARRKATQDAGRMAGLEVLDIINEPTAAALAYGCQHGMLDANGATSDGPTRILVYDLGGGTFDVTILEIDGNKFRAIATDGDVQLGGKDFDERIAQYLAEQFIEQHGIDPRSDPRDAAQLWIDAQRIKHTLSQRSRTSAVVFHAGVRLNVEITRDKFEELTCDLLERTETTTSQVTREAGLTWDDIDRVLLVGGSSRMPGVTQMLKKATGHDVDCSLSPDEAIAKGAALHAAMLTQQGATKVPQIELINVNSHSLGIRGVDMQTKRRINAIMIPKNTPLPCKQVKIFTTAEQNQRSVKVVVLEGESHRPEDCIQLGDCVIRDLPEGLPKGSKIEVTYRYLPDGRVAVSARMPNTRQSAQVKIQRSDEAELEDLESWRQRLTSSNAIEPESGSPPQAAAPTTTDKSDLGSVLRRLDQLYMKVGLAAVRTAVPSNLQKAQQSAQENQAAFRAASAALDKAEKDNQNPPTRADAVRFGAVRAKAKTKFEQMESRANFSCLLLGRECIQNGSIPKAVKEHAAEIKSLRARLESR
jgi:molecular chaperone DnaK